MSRLALLQQYLAETPEDAFLLFAIAREYEGLQDTAMALHYYLLLRGKHPGYVGLYYHLGKLYERIDQPHDAWETYTTGMTKAQQANDQHAWAELTGARLALGDEDDFE
ncbi:MAG: tetratricopeptide repeat protein [Saprospiraceae bacterium]